MWYSIGNMTDSKQTGLTRDEKGRITGGTPPAGFNVNPQNIASGRWDKENSISYWYNKIGRMSDDELKEFKPANQNQKIALKRILDAQDDLATTKEITDRTEGKAPQTLDISNPDGSLNPYNALSVEELKKLANK